MTLELDRSVLEIIKVVSLGMLCIVDPTSLPVRQQQVVAYK